MRAFLSEKERRPYSGRRPHPYSGLTCNRVQWAKAAKTLMVVKLDEGMKVVWPLSVF